MKFKQLYILILLLTTASIAQSFKKYELVEIKFEGNNTVSSSVLNSIIVSKESPNWLSQFLFLFTSIGGKAIYFDSLLIPLDVSSIKSYYQSKGYFKVKITPSYSLDNSKNESVLKFTIHESEPAFFKSFVVKGLHTIDPEYEELLTAYNRVDTNKIYEDAIVEEKKNYTLTFLRDHGFMLGQADQPQVIVDTIKNKVDVLLNFNSGKRYKVRELFTKRTGESIQSVDDNLIKEIVGIPIGSWYSNYEIQRAQVRLFRTNLFTSAAVMSVISDTAGNTVPLNINADIGLLNELSPEIIMNNEDNTFNLGLALNFIRKNFFGDARKFTIGTSAAAQNVSEFLRNPSFTDSSFYGYADARVSIEQPFLFGKSINTKLETYFTAQKRKNEYNSQLYGAKLNFDFELPQTTYFTSFSAYLNVVRSEYNFKVPYLRNLFSQNEQRKNNSSKSFADSVAKAHVDNVLGGKFISQSTNAIIGLNFSANKTNETFFPTTGYSLSLLFEDANSIPYLFSKIFKSEFSHPLFFKSVVTSTFYLPFFDTRTDAFGIKFKVGQIFTYNGDKAGIPLNQRFYSGGSNSIRGWATRQLVPPVHEFNLNANPTKEDLVEVLGKGTASGGFFLFEGSLETRNRLFGSVGSALFIDYGNTWNSSNEFRFDEVALAAGFGLRYYSEYVPIRIDFGFKIYDPNDRRSMFKKEFWKEILQFHIGIGEAF